MKKIIFLLLYILTHLQSFGQCESIEDCLEKLNSKVGTTIRYLYNQTSYTTNFRFYEDRINVIYNDGGIRTVSLQWSEIRSFSKTYAERISMYKEVPGYSIGSELIITPKNILEADIILSLIQEILDKKGILGYSKVHVSGATIRDPDAEYWPRKVVIPTDEQIKERKIEKRKTTFKYVIIGILSIGFGWLMNTYLFDL